MMELSIGLVPILPLLAAAWLAFSFLLGWQRTEENETSVARITIGANLLSLGLSVWHAVQYWWLGATPQQIVFAPWFHSGEFNVYLSLTVDGLSLSMSVLSAFILFIVSRFSVNYLHREAGFKRFFMVLALFSSAMQFIALSGNAILTFVGWELAGVSSYLLIAYNWQSSIATTNATRAFVTNRLGDAGFLLAIFMAFTWYGGVEWAQLFTPHHELSRLIAAITALGFIGAAVVKSAQFPFSSWITRALEGPTPSSTVFYGAVMVHAGVYLLLRVHPLLQQVPEMEYVLMLVGALTVGYAWLSGLVQTDIKTSLVFSTLGQTGLMLIGIGLGWYTWVLIHLSLHALWRTYQFLHSPSFALHVDWQPAPEHATWLYRYPWLLNAALQRFWLDVLADWLLVKPTKGLSQEAQVFDGHILDKLSGTPNQHSGISSLAEMQALQEGKLRLENQIGVGSGLLGKLMQWIAEQLEWFEQRLLLQQSGGSARHTLEMLGRYLERLERLLIQPRYLVLLVAVTLVIIF